MKKLLLISILFLSFQAFSQRHASAEKQLETAESFLADDPCHSTGIAWLKEVLKKQPENKEALELKNRCRNFKLSQVEPLISEAKNLAKEYSDNNTGVTSRLDEVLEIQPENPEANYLRAKAHYKSGGYRNAVEKVSKGITVNPDNLEYRWLRAKSLLTDDFDIANLELAIRDLNFIAKADGGAKVYANIAIAERELARTHRNNGNDKTAVVHYQRAKENASKAVEIEPEYATTISPEGIDKELKMLKNKI